MIEIEIDNGKNGMIPGLKYPLIHSKRFDLIVPKSLRRWSDGYRTQVITETRKRDDGSFTVWSISSTIDGWQERPFPMLVKDIEDLLEKMKSVYELVT